MAVVAVGEDLDIQDVFESDIQLGATPTNGELTFRLEKPDGTLAANWIFPNANIIDKGANKYHIEYRVDMAGIWYWEWKPDGALAALVQGWFRAVPLIIGRRTIV